MKWLLVLLAVAAITVATQDNRTSSPVIENSQNNDRSSVDGSQGIGDRQDTPEDVETPTAVPDESNNAQITPGNIVTPTSTPTTTTSTNSPATTAINSPEQSKYSLNCPGLRTYSFTRALAKRLESYRIKPLSPRIVIDVAMSEWVDIGCVRFEHLVFNSSDGEKTSPVPKGCKKPSPMQHNITVDITCQVVVVFPNSTEHVFSPSDHSVVNNFGKYYQKHGVCGTDWRPCHIARPGSSEDPNKITRFFFQFPPDPDPTIHDGVWRISIYNALQQRFVMDETCTISFLPYGEFPGDDLSMLSKAVENFDLAVENTIEFLNKNVSRVKGCSLQDVSINH